MAVTLTAAGLAAFGAVAGSEGVATAATQLTVATCTGAANQKWTGPDKSPA